MRSSRWWIVALLASVVLASSPLARPLNLWASHTAIHMAGRRASDWMAVWPVGNVVVAAVLLLVLPLGGAGHWRQRLTAWGLFLLGLGLEVLAKRLDLGTGRPVLRTLHMPSMAPTVAAVTHSVSRALPPHLWPWLLTQLHVVGTFPSGHVLRLTLVAGYSTPEPAWPLAAAVAAIASFAVVATAGHTLTDALGGAILALGLLSLGGRLTTRRGARWRPRGRGRHRRH